MHNIYVRVYVCIYIYIYIYINNIETDIVIHIVHLLDEYNKVQYRIHMGPPRHFPEPNIKSLNICTLRGKGKAHPRRGKEVPEGE